MIPDGIWPVMLTPFNQDGSINMPAYDYLIDFYIQHKVAGLFACCGSSEINTMTPDELIKIARYVVEYVDGRISVVVGAIMFSDMQSQVEFAKEMAATGVNAVVISTNQFNNEQEDRQEFFKKLRYFTDAVDEIPLGTYELPVPYNRTIPLEVFKWMADSGRFVFHKDTSCSIDNIKAKIALRKNSKLKIFNAHLRSLLQSFIAGANGYCGTGTNYCPDLYGWLWENFNKLPEQAQQLQNYLINFEDQVDLGQNYPASAKAFLKLRNVRIEPFCRVGVKAVAKSQIKQLSAILADSVQFKEKLLKV